MCAVGPGRIGTKTCRVDRGRVAQCAPAYSEDVQTERPSLGNDTAEPHVCRQTWGDSAHFDTDLAYHPEFCYVDESNYDSGPARLGPGQPGGVRTY